MAYGSTKSLHGFGIVEPHQLILFGRSLQRLMSDESARPVSGFVTREVGSLQHGVG